MALVFLIVAADSIAHPLDCLTVWRGVAVVLPALTAFASSRLLLLVDLAAVVLVISVTIVLATLVERIIIPVSIVHDELDSTRGTADRVNRPPRHVSYCAQARLNQGHRDRSSLPPIAGARTLSFEDTRPRAQASSAYGLRI